MLKVGIVGSGNMGTVHAAAWSQTPVELAGIRSLHDERAKRLADRYFVRTFDSLEDLIDHSDVLDICTPTDLHHQMALQAARAGKHIVCEKPLARTVAQAKEMVEACRKAGVRLLVAHVVRFFPQYAQAKAAVDRGDIGQVAVVRLTRCAFQPKLAVDNWFLNPARSGGMMLDLMIHDFDYARWVAGEVESVYARSVRSADPNAPEDYALAILRHRSGAISNVEGGWAYPPPMFRTALEIAGDAGLIEHPADSSAPLSIHLKSSGADDSAELGLPLSPLAEDPYTTQIRHFHDVLTGRTQQARVEAEDGLIAVQIALAAVESARSGRSVKIAEVR